MTVTDFGGPSGELARLAAEASPDPLLLVEESGTILYANAAARILFGDRVVAEPVATLLHVDGPPLHQLFGAAGMSRRATALGADGNREEVDVTFSGDLDGITAVTLRRQSDPGISTIELLRRATHDDLTQLANRASLVDRMTEDLRGGDRGHHALIMLDLDGFKQINDGFGHEVGDQVLVEIARRLRMSCRPGDHVARFGGDEFALWCPGIRDESALAPLVHRLLEVIEEPLPIGSASAGVGASIGVVLTADAAVDCSELLARADAAMYRAKSLGRGCSVVYDEALGRDLVRTRSLERALDQAINDDHLELHYQAIVDLLSGEPVGAEALVRWPHPRLGLIPPTELVDVATRTHLLASMTHWVLEASVAEAARWNRVLPEPLSVSVNLASSQLVGRFVDQVVTTLGTYDVDPRLLTIEITEELVSPRHTASIELLAELHALGVRIAIDDFGTGRSSLSALQELSVDVLKIAPDFVNGVAHSKRQTAIVDAVVRLGHALDLDVIAEGVETAEDLEAVRDLGCDLAQGFHLAAPAPARSVDWLPSRRG